MFYSREKRSLRNRIGIKHGAKIGFERMKWFSIRDRDSSRFESRFAFAPSWAERRLATIISWLCIIPTVWDHGTVEQRKTRESHYAARCFCFLHSLLRNAMWRDTIALVCSSTSINYLRNEFVIPCALKNEISFILVARSAAAAKMH